MALALPPEFLHCAGILSVHTWSAGSEYTAMPFYAPQNLEFNYLFGTAQALTLTNISASEKKSLFKIYHIVSISNLGDKKPRHIRSAATNVALYRSTFLNFFFMPQSQSRRTLGCAPQLPGWEIISTQLPCTNFSQLASFFLFAGSARKG